MKINGKQYRSVWFDPASNAVGIFDQTLLPHHVETLALTTLDHVCHAIVSMQVRGAPLIGAVAAYGYAIALQRDAGDDALAAVYSRLFETRPTAVNLRWALDRVRAAVAALPPAQRAAQALATAHAIADEDVAVCSAIGDYGLDIIRSLSMRNPRGKPLNILTHCNAGWLATVDWGTALAPIYKAYDAGIAVHVWVDETRPRVQGGLTAFELAQHGVPHTVIADNTGGHLMQNNLVDMCIVGTDRTTANGDVCNKIGTYLKALAAYDNGVPFYVALPVSTIDWTLPRGVGAIPIEERDPMEISHVTGVDERGQLARVRLYGSQSQCANHAFDVTPARLVTALITEAGVFDASVAGLAALKSQLEPVA